MLLSSLSSSSISSSSLLIYRHWKKSKPTRPSLDLRSPSAGTGKSTVLNMLAGRLKPNLGTSEDNDDGLAPPSWSDIIKFYRGSELQLYFVGLRTLEH